MRMAVMQPYFISYAGYFRLFAATDLFVLYDCVQFPRRGWVHRNKLLKENGEADWLTLPLAKAPQDVRIDQLAFAPRVEEWRQEWRAFPAMKAVAGSLKLDDFSGTPVDYLERSLKAACDLLGIPFRTARSSALNLPETLKGQERILAICEHFGCGTYVNPPGGRELYDAAAFTARGMRLSFLPPYDAPLYSIAQRLADTPRSRLTEEITQRCTLDYA